MTADELAKSAATDVHPPDGINSAACALWLAKAGRWDAAHDLCEEIPNSDGAWIHAYLHREEGDLSNAAYWYSKAGKPTAQGSLEDEWLEMARALI